MDTAETQRREAEDAVLRLEGKKSHYDALLRTLRESLENLTGERESLAGRLEDNARRAGEAGC